MSNARRILVYIIPVTALSFALNIPKFMEVTITETNGTNAVDPSQTRLDVFKLLASVFLSFVWIDFD